MLTRFRKAMEEREEGFTLIELLVVVIIIGILAAIAIPVFLSQRSKAYDSSAKSDLRNFAVQEEAYLAEPTNVNATQTYGTLAQVTANENFKQSNSVSMAVAAIGANGYCAIARNTNSTKAWVWDSSQGGLQQATVASGATYTCKVDNTTTVTAP